METCSIHITKKSYTTYLNKKRWFINILRALLTKKLSCYSLIYSLLYFKKYIHMSILIHYFVLEKNSDLSEENMDKKKTKWKQLFGGLSEITTPPRVRYLGIRHRCHSKEEIDFYNTKDSFLSLVFDIMSFFLVLNSPEKFVIFNFFIIKSLIFDLIKKLQRSLLSVVQHTFTFREIQVL